MVNRRESPGVVLGAVLILLAFGVNAEKPNFSLLDLEGKTHQLSDYRGKWVVVNYWATWCPPCLDEIPELEDFHNRRKDKDALVLGVNMENIGLEQLREFVDSLLVTYPILREKPRPYTELGVVSGLPTTYIISPEGEVVAWQVGPVTAKHLDDFLARKARATPVKSVSGKP